MDDFSFKTLEQSLAAQGTHACNCVGPKNGQPLCPCAMRGVQIINGRYVLPAVDLGPVPHQNGGSDWKDAPSQSDPCEHDPLKPKCTLMHQFNQPGRTTCTVCKGTFWLPVTSAQKSGEQP